LGLLPGAPLSRQPALALGVQIPKIRSGDGHPVQQHLNLGIRLRADRLNLPLVAVSASLRFQEVPERCHVTLAQHLAKLDPVRWVVGRHRRGSPDQPWFGPP
jgi:hypothetical protein